MEEETLNHIANKYLAILLLTLLLLTDEHVTMRNKQDPIGLNRLPRLNMLTWGKKAENTLEHTLKQGNSVPRLWKCHGLI